MKKKKPLISISTKSIATKLDKLMAYDIKPPRTKSHDSLIRWSYVVSGQLKNVIPSPVLRTPKHETTKKTTSPLVKSFFNSFFFSTPAMYV